MLHSECYRLISSYFVAATMTHHNSDIEIEHLTHIFKIVKIFLIFMQDSLDNDVTDF